ncbi:DUF2628 domain-containing protein [Magnetovibrio sp. PR-2]|uniref:DUF2628 domain-containing protein n=1 Tax=Magnetovibrio sp. PR-2 TaxID=3120356 RepID=UPI002FCDF461
MSIYTVHVRDTGIQPTLAVVKDGFSWPAAVFGFIWALVVGAWEVALMLFGVQIGVGFVLELLISDPSALAVVQIGLAVVIGLVANELRRWHLEKRGLYEDAVVTANNKEEAERRYLDANPYMTAKLLRDEC